MAILTLEVENKKMKFIKDLLQHFSFVRVREESTDEDSDEQVVSNILKGIREMRQIEQGKKKGRPSRDFLAEL
jgi:hypothetical protein